MEVKKFYCEKCGKTHVRYIQCQVDKQRVEELKQIDLENDDDLFKSKILEPYGFAAVEGAKEIGNTLKEDLSTLLNEDSNLENDAIEFYLSKLYDNFDVYLVVSHPVHPTEEQSISLLFKIIDRIEKDNIFRIKTGWPTVKYERSYNKLKITWNS